MVCPYFADHRLSRRLEFQSYYDIACDILDDDMTGLIATQAQMTYTQLEIVCGDCEFYFAKILQKCEFFTIQYRCTSA